MVDSDPRAWDTYWGFSNSGAYLLTKEELLTAEVLFNLNDYHRLRLGTEGLNESEWEKYAPEDRQIITSQHGLRKVWLIRKGALPSWEQQIENARERVEEAKRELASAESKLRWAESDLSGIMAQAELAE